MFASVCLPVIQTAHIILTIEDSRPLNLTAYKRIILYPN